MTDDRTRVMKLVFERAAVDDAATLAALRTATATRLTEEYGEGPWSRASSERGALFGMRQAYVVVARDDASVGANASSLGGIVASFTLSTKKPWAIDRSYFAKSLKPLYLTDMSVAPTCQREGVGRECLREAARLARAWPADAIRLDAYDAPAGAGEFYARCGYHEVGRATYRNTPLVYYELLL